MFKTLRLSLTVFFCLFLYSGPNRCSAQQVDPYQYDLGTPALRVLWVDPVSGNDGNSGASASQSLRTVTAAWNRIPSRETLSGQGYRILLQPGEYTSSHLPNYWEDRWGSAAAPIILQASAGRGTVHFRRDLNVFGVRHLALIDFEISPVPAGDAFHCEQCDHLLLRGMTFSGGARVAQETIKINQSQHIYIEESSISGAWDNAIDFVSVQYGHLVRNTIQDAGDWCAYVKGGSAYIRVEGNRISNCGTGGFTAGQGAGIEFITSPWLHYEAYDVKFMNNVVTNTEGAAVGVNGGYNILIAHNSFYRVGTRSHAIEVVHGSHSCDGNTVQCAQRVSQGGWGVTGGGEAFIPSRNVFILNNVLLNPAGVRSQWSHFAIAGPRDNPSATNIPNPSRVDDNLVIRGNVLWNGPSDLALGVEESDQGCRPSNPTCNADQLRSQNLINVIAPELIDPEHGDLRPVPTGNLSATAIGLIPNFAGGDRPTTPASPTGNLVNTVTRDFNATPRGAQTAVGAFTLNSNSAPPPSDPGAPADPGTPSEPPPAATDPFFGGSLLSSSTLSSRGGPIAIAVAMGNAADVELVVCFITRGNWQRVFVVPKVFDGGYIGISPFLPRNSTSRAQVYTVTLAAQIRGGRVIFADAGNISVRRR